MGLRQNVNQTMHICDFEIIYLRSIPGEWQPVKNVLELKKKGKDASYDYQMTYLKKKYDEFIDLAWNEITKLDDYLYAKALNNAKIYRNPRWVELQRLLEDRYENLMSIAEHVNKRYDNGKSSGEYDTQLRPMEATKYITQKTAPPKIIGGILFLAVLAWLKHMAQNHRMRRLSSDQNYRFQENDYDDLSPVDYDDLTPVDYDGTETRRKPTNRRQKKNRHRRVSFDDELESL